MAWAYEKTGDAARQRQACRQLVLRSEEIGVAGDADEVVAARRFLESAAGGWATSGNSAFVSPRIPC